METGEGLSEASCTFSLAAGVLSREFKFKSAGAFLLEDLETGENLGERDNE